MFASAYNGRNVLVTGHNGFKGSWLSLWLQQLGARLSGFSLPLPSRLNHWDLLGLKTVETLDLVESFAAIKRHVDQTRPEIVFHLAAQPLVRASYSDPLGTWNSNVIGTVNVLEACRQAGCVKAIVVVTTDKCYENREHFWGYREHDRLGGHDPYSASKAAAELVVASYRQSYFQAAGSPLLASARAGNVIGGGDWSPDRLIPDAIRAIERNEQLVIRSPLATRPWQHVLESLSGYLLLGAKLLNNDRCFADAWNFGPGGDGNRSVSELLQSLQSHLPQLSWGTTVAPQPHEATLLQLDTTKALHLLGWKPVWTTEEGIQYTAQWYDAFLKNRSAISQIQLNVFLEHAQKRQACWTV